MKKLLFQLDTDSQASVFDQVVGYDGGADQVVPYAQVTPEQLRAMVEGAIFTRAPKDKKNTALFFGGSDLAAGEALMAAAERQFFGSFRVSMMLDCNGANTTAAACVAWLVRGRSVRGRRAVVLAGTGPVGQRVAAMLALEGAAVCVTGRQMERAVAATQAIAARFAVEVAPLATPDAQSRAAAVSQAHIVVSTGAAGVVLLSQEQWRDLPQLELLADANASPPAGLEGIEMADRGALRHGKTCYGPLGFGALKLALHRACIGRLFEQNDLLLDAREILAIARQMIA